ncbi:MAG: alpha/beta fold hydrolase [Caldilineaceae bacterium]|nr:alpha/beta fold hydrolase [Caldilineaceae bacterium]
MRIQLSLALFLLLSLFPKIGYGQSETVCTRDVIVNAGDTLIGLAGAYLGDPLAYPRIIAATNDAASVDDSYSVIDNEGRIMVGWTLCLPDPLIATQSHSSAARSTTPGVDLLPTTAASAIVTTTIAPTNSATASPAVAARTGTQPGQEWSTDPDPLQIEVMRQQSYPGSQITVEEVLEPGINYSRYVVSYLSDGLTIYALMTIPFGVQPADGWPAIVFNHGYITPSQYRTTERYTAYVDMLARNGYIVLKPDLRGHGNSGGEEVIGGGYGTPDYTVDVLNAVASLQAHEDVDPNRIGMWGHSMGGQLTLRAMVVTDDIKAGVIWGGVVSPYPDIIERWDFTRNTDRFPGMSASQAITSQSSAGNWLRDFSHWVSDFTAKYGDFDENPLFWATISPNNFLEDLSGPIELHHSTTDEMVPLAWSETLAQQLDAADQQPYDLFTYSGDNHNISANFGIAMQRTVAFFDQYVKGQERLSE